MTLKMMKTMMNQMPWNGLVFRLVSNTSVNKITSPTVRAISDPLEDLVTRTCP